MALIIDSKIIEKAEFPINKELLKEDFDSNKKKDRKEWFLDTYNKKKRKFIKEI